MAKEPSDRPANAEAFVAELRAAVEGIQGLNLPSPTSDTTSFPTGSLPHDALSTGASPSPRPTPPNPLPPTINMPGGLNSGGTIVVQAPPANNTALWVIIALLVLIAAGGTFVFINSSDSSPQSQQPAPASPPSLVKLTLNSDPPGATVFINDKPAGPTPFTYEGQPGDKPKIVFKLKPAYEDHTAPEITIDPAMQNQYFAKLKRRRLVLRVTSPLPRSMLAVAGTNLGTMLKGQTLSDSIDWPDQELILTIRSDTHEDFVLKLSPAALDAAVEDGEFEVEPFLDLFIPKVAP